MGHVPIHGAPPPPANWVGECFYCGRQFIYGERSDCVSCGGLLPLKRNEPPTPGAWFNTAMGVSTGRTPMAASTVFFLSPWVGVGSPSRMMRDANGEWFHPPSWYEGDE